MIVIPTKWVLWIMPWLMAMTGIGMVLSGEGDVWSVLMTIAGIAWLYARYKK